MIFVRHAEKFRKFFAIGFALVAIIGCASSASVWSSELGANPNPATVQAKQGWWFLSFPINWPEHGEPLWHLDLLLAHQVICPVLEKYEKEIGLWRFHRRATKDKYGHVFSFIFYSSPNTADKVYKSVQTNMRLKELKDAGLVSREGCDDLKEITKPCIEDTSDASWSDPMKKSWPHFIMGASRAWLALIIEVANGNSKGASPLSLEDSTAFYKSVDAYITQAWQEEGQHAFLHHLNAMFGYKPLFLYERRPVGF